MRPFHAYSDTDGWEWVLSILSSDRARLFGEPDPPRGLDETWKACGMNNSQIGKTNMMIFSKRNGVSINNML